MIQKFRLKFDFPSEGGCTTQSVPVAVTDSDICLDSDQVPRPDSAGVKINKHYSQIESKVTTTSLSLHAGAATFLAP